jgi:putative glutamine amidotransferase
MTPLRIAITPSRSTRDYERSIVQAGGEPLVLTGGGDIDPALFGEDRHPTFHEAEPGRDAAEIALVHQAIETGLPLLAICRGAQVLNVARGGSLIQDIPSELPLALNHRVPTPPTASAHSVHVSAGTRLASLLGLEREGGRVEVNSRHHQAPRRLGDGLVVCAVAEDGVVEGLELPGDLFCLGVQWHPENYVETGEFQALFDGLLEAAGAGR